MTVNELLVLLEERKRQGQGDVDVVMYLDYIGYVVDIEDIQFSDIDGMVLVGLD